MRPGVCQAGAHLCVMGPKGLLNLLSHSGKEAAAHEGAQSAQRQEHGGGQPAQAGEDRGQRERAQAQHVPCTPPRNAWRNHEWPPPHTTVTLQLQQQIPDMTNSQGFKALPMACGGRVYMHGEFSHPA